MIGCAAPTLGVTDEILFLGKPHDRLFCADLVDAGARLRIDRNYPGFSLESLKRK